MRIAWKIAVHEFWANRWRNALFGFIIGIALIAQVVVAMAIGIGQVSADKYGEAQFGAEQTHFGQLEGVNPPALRDLNQRFADLHEAHPWFAGATMVTGFAVATAPGLEGGGAGFSERNTFNLVGASAGWPLVSVSAGTSDALTEVLDPERTAPAAVVDATYLTYAEEYGYPVLAPGMQISLAQSGAIASAGDSPDDAMGMDEWQCDQYGNCWDSYEFCTPNGDCRPADAVAEDESLNAVTDQLSVDRKVLRNVPVYGQVMERSNFLQLDKSSPTLWVNQDTAFTMMSANDEYSMTSVIYRCDPQFCEDAKGFVENAIVLAGFDAKPDFYETSGELRYYRDQIADLRKYGNAFSLAVLLFGIIVVTAMAAGFIEVREPTFATFRTLGASKFKVALICILENVFVAALVGGLGIGLTAILVSQVPDLLYEFGAPEYAELPVLWGTYAKLGVITILTGVAAGLLPALRAYRAMN